MNLFYINMINLSVNTPFFNKINMNSPSIQFKGNSLSSTDSFTKTGPSYRIKVSDRQSIPLNQNNSWALYDESRFEDFINSDKDLQEPIKDLLNFFKIYRIKPSLTMFLQNNYDGVEELFGIIDKKYGVKFDKQPNVYRFIGKSELDELLVNKKVFPQRYFNKFDVTTNPDLNWNQYRITFKPTEKNSIINPESQIEPNIGCNKEDYYYLKIDKYTIHDVQCVERRTENGYEKVYSSNFD